MKKLYLLLAFLLLAACCRVDNKEWGSSHNHHQCSPKLGSFFEVPLHGVFTESYYGSELKLCEYTNGFLKGVYGKGAVFEGEPTIIHGFIRGWISEYFAAGTYTKLYLDSTSDSGDWFSMIEDNGHFFNGSTNDDIGFLSAPWSFTHVRKGQCFCPEKINYSFPIVVPTPSS